MCLFEVAPVFAVHMRGVCDFIVCTYTSVSIQSTDCSLHCQANGVHSTTDQITAITSEGEQ